MEIKSLEDIIILNELLGRGALGFVQPAYIKKTHSFVAVKLISIDLLYSKNAQAQHLLEEKRIMHKLHHPLIIELLCTYKTDDTMYMFYELVKNGNLGKHIQCQNIYTSFDYSLIQFYCAELVLILQYLHSNHIVHRDIKADNILLGNNGHIKLIDFGCAIDLKKQTSAQLGGTITHIRPSLQGKITAAAEDVDVGFVDDWYAFGVFMYHILFRKLPFWDMEKQQLNININNLEFPLEEIRDGVEKYDEYLNMIDLIKGLLNESLCTHETVKSHIYFNNIIFDKLLETSPPCIPQQLSVSIEEYKELVDDIIAEERDDDDEFHDF